MSFTFQDSIFHFRNYKRTKDQNTEFHQLRLRQVGEKTEILKSDVRWQCHCRHKPAVFFFFFFFKICRKSFAPCLFWGTVDMDFKSQTRAWMHGNFFEHPGMPCFTNQPHDQASSVSRSQIYLHVFHPHHGRSITFIQEACYLARSPI